MSRIPLIVLAVGGWIYTAAAFQDYGKTWAVNTCTGVPGICDHPNLFLCGAVVVATALSMAMKIKHF